MFRLFNQSFERLITAAEFVHEQVGRERRQILSEASLGPKRVHTESIIKRHDAIAGHIFYGYQRKHDEWLREWYMGSGTGTTTSSNNNNIHNNSGKSYLPYKTDAQADS